MLVKLTLRSRLCRRRLLVFGREHEAIIASYGLLLRQRFAVLQIGDFQPDATAKDLYNK